MRRFLSSFFLLFFQTSTITPRLFRKVVPLLLRFASGAKSTDFVASVVTFAIASLSVLPEATRTSPFANRYVTETSTTLLNLLIFRTVISFSMCIQCTKFCGLSIFKCFFSHFFFGAWTHRFVTQLGTRYAPSICHANPPVFLKKKLLIFV